MIGFRNVDMAELRIHTPAERVAIAESHLFRVAFAIFFQLSQAAEFQDVPLFPGVFFLPGNKKRVRRGVNVDISGNGRRVSVARFPSGRRQPARGFRAG